MRVFAAVALLACVGLAGCQDDPVLDYYRIDAGIQSGHQASEQAGYLVIETQAVWEAFWTVHDGGRDRPRPDVDFEHRWVLAVFAGQKPTTGYGISVAETDPETGEPPISYTTSDDTYFVKVVELRPGDGCPTADVITYPYDLVSIGRVGDEPFTVTVQPQPGLRLDCSDF